MKKLILQALMLALLLLFLGGVAFSQSGLIWQDEFNGTSLDMSKWILWDEADGDDSWYSPGNVSVSGGVLTIANREETRSDGRHWTGGHIDATYHPQYKYLEARCRITSANTAVWPAFWTVGWVNNTWKWPPEFDIFEYMGYIGQDQVPGQWYHYYTAEGWHTWQGKECFVNEADWHTYGVYWTAAGPVFYLDGYKNVTPGLGGGAQTTEAALIKITSSPNAYGRYAGCPLSNFQVDYVRVYDNPPNNGSMPPTDGTISMNKPAFASSGGAPNSANDGRMDTRWESDWSDPQWLSIDLEGTKNITQVQIEWEAASARAYQIQVSSNNSNWTTVYSTTTGDGGNDTINLSASAAYIRIYGTERNTGYGYSIWEFKIFGSGGTVATSTPVPQNTATPTPTTAAATSTPVAGGDTLVTGMTATASSALNPAGNSCDGNTATRWESMQGSDSQWIYWDLGSSRNLSRIVIDWEVASAANYRIEGSTNASTWTTLATVTNSSTADHNSITTNISGSYRYVRMYGISRTTGWGYSIWETYIYVTGGSTGATSTPTRTPAPAANTATPTPPASAATPTPTRRSGRR
ncbi:MAG: discoidin domain-containing protein [Spirochaetales bacterium]|nr:discoidin domain-containing protein [Spirochaetales bacterium]